MNLPTLFKFEPIHKPRPWGGHALAQTGADHPPQGHDPIGEAWEITDRPGDESVVRDGPLAGRTIRQLLDEHGAEVMGCAWPRGRRFPLLVKVLDAAERLSLQVHPPASVAGELAGEPKTEMWYLLEATPTAGILAGLKRGVTRADFEQCLRAGRSHELEDMVHRLPVRRGDAIFIPSGRLHAIDAGCLILEIQQNSDTTYRVFDWGRVRLDGTPRELHVEQSLRCIDFEDFAPSLAPRSITEGTRRLADCDHFHVESWELASERAIAGDHAAVLHVTEGNVAVSGPSGEAIPVRAGETALLSAMPHRIRPQSSRATVVIAWCR